MVRFDYDDSEVSSIRRTWTSSKSALQGDFTLDAFGEPILNYQNTAIRLNIECQTQQHTLRVTLVPKNGTPAVSLVIEYGTQLVWVIKEFRTHQESLSTETLPNFLRHLADHAVRIYRETPRGLVAFADAF